MKLRDRLPMTFAEVELTIGKPLRAVATDIHGMSYRGRLVAYAEDEGGERFAMIEDGREIRPVPTERREIAVGKQVRARLVSSLREAEASERERRRGLMWQLADLELERDRGRGR